jgi:hypothetical protein
MKRTILCALLLLSATPALAKNDRENMTGKKELGMERCPSAVPGAKTTVTDVPGGVVVTVRAPHDGVAQAEIHSRVQFQMDAQAEPTRGAIEHTGMGTGSGRYGFCPGMIEHTTLDVQWLADGAKMTVRADKPEDAAQLQSTTRQRARALAQKMHQSAKR